MSSRVLSPYEINQLYKYKVTVNNIEDIGDTPIEYITGHAQFCNLDFTVSSHTLIPRIESEQIISLALSYLKFLGTTHLDIADIGTGSGCLGISLAHRLLQNSFESFDIYLSDISSTALQIAKRNQSEILPNQKSRFHFLTSDLFINYPPHQQFDLIMANLPYIPSARIPSLDKSVKKYEPHLALDGGSDGTSIINRLLNNISPHLKPHSQAILEVDSIHSLQDFIIPAHINPFLIKDIFDQPRFLLLRNLN